MDGAQSVREVGIHHKDGQAYMVRYKAGQEQAAIQVVGRWINDPEMPGFTFSMGMVMVGVLMQVPVYSLLEEG